MESPFDLAFRAVLICMQLRLSFAAELSNAQTRKPTAKEVASIRDCVTKNKDDLKDAAGERRCLFNLVAEPCIKRTGETDVIVADCYRTEASIWNGMLNDNYTSLDATGKTRLPSEQ